MILHLKITGTLLVVLSLIHIVFPKQFEWTKELSSLNLLNRQMMYVHTFFIALTVLLMGLLCLAAPDDLLDTKIGKIILLGLFIFWAARLAIQFVGYSSRLWKGKRKETVIHILFSILWTYLTMVFLFSYLEK